MMRFLLPKLLAPLLALVTATAALAQSQAPRDTLGAGDSVRVTVFQNPDLTTEARLSDRGVLHMPLIGEVNVNGLSPTQAANRIAERFKSGKFILNPQVTVATTQVRSRQVAVLGQVNRPGKYALEDSGNRVTDVLAIAGGISPTGADAVTLTRAKDQKKLDINLAEVVRNPKANIEVQNGDTLFVQRAPTFYIHGEVQRAGSYRLEPNMTVMHALSTGGGITLRGTQRGMKIHRRGTDGKLIATDAKLTDPVQADDVIFVKESLF
jgi:polysaccharide export outer membrane protein